jgi:glycosyltransferase involved in cell wall biosynthesis
MKTAIIVPSYNEAPSIARVVGEIRSAVPDADIIVINDGSRDQTAAISLGLGTTVISHQVNIGYGAAVQTGLHYACAKQFDTVILLDADGQHDPSFIPSMVQALELNHADVVIGSRFSGEYTYHVSLARRIGLNLFRAILYLITRQTFKDITSGYKLFDRRAAKFLANKFPTDFPDAQILLSLLLNGFKIVEVSARFRTRTAGQSMYSFSRKLYYPFKMLLAILIVFLSQIFKPTKE